MAEMNESQNEIYSKNEKCLSVWFGGNVQEESVIKSKKRKRSRRVQKCLSK
jgi:hypothetical protein